MILGIYGAGGLGREVFELASVINDKNKTNKEVFKKTYVNKRFIRESIQHYDTKS